MLVEVEGLVDEVGDRTVDIGEDGLADVDQSERQAVIIEDDEP